MKEIRIAINCQQTDRMHQTSYINNFQSQLSMEIKKNHSTIPRCWCMRLHVEKSDRASQESIAGLQMPSTTWCKVQNLTHDYKSVQTLPMHSAETTTLANVGHQCSHHSCSTCPVLVPSDCHQNDESFLSSVTTHKLLLSVVFHQGVSALVAAWLLV